MGCKEGGPWELMYADDIIIAAESRAEVEEMFKRQKAHMKESGLKVNTGKTKLMVARDIQTEPV